MVLRKKTSQNTPGRGLFPKGPICAGVQRLDCVWRILVSSYPEAISAAEPEHLRNLDFNQLTSVT